MANTSMIAMNQAFLQEGQKLVEESVKSASKATATSAKAAPFLRSPDIISADAGDAPVFAPRAGIDAYASPHNETSTGVAVTPYRPAGADPDALVPIDATSGAMNDLKPNPLIVTLRTPAEEAAAPAAGAQAATQQ